MKNKCNLLRKRRKWPLSPHKTKWHQTFNHQQAMQSLKTSLPPSLQIQSPTHLLSTLTSSFTYHNCSPTPHAYHFLLKILSQSSQLHLLHPLLLHLQRFENFSTPEYILIDLIKIYGRFNKIDEAITVFLNMQSYRCVPSVDSLNALLLVLCRKREWLCMVPQVLLKSQEMGVRVEESSFGILVNALCRFRKVGFAIEVMNCLLSDGHGVDFKICSLILGSLCERKGFCDGVEVLGFLGEIRRLGFVPSGVDYGNVIRFLVREGRGMDALNVLNQMKVDGIKPDIVCYTMVLDGVVSYGDYAKADELFDELLVLGLVPDVFTYNVYIKCLCRQNDVDEGFRMLACMEELGCKPHLVTYNTLLEGLCEVGEVSRARELIREMGLKGFKPNFHTYRIMIDGLVNKGEIFEACGFFEEMLDKCSCPKNSSFDEIICGVLGRGLVCKGLELLEKMVAKSVAPGAKAWESLLLSFGSELSFAETTLADLVNPIEASQLQLPEC